MSFIQQRALKNQTIRRWLGLPQKNVLVVDDVVSPTAKMPFRKAFTMIKEAKAESRKRAAKAVMDATSAAVNAGVKA